MNPSPRRTVKLFLLIAVPIIGLLLFHTSAAQLPQSAAYLPQKEEDDALAGPDRGDRAVAPDQPGEEENLNREIWEYSKTTPYSDVVQYVKVAQESSRQSSQPPTVSLPNGWNISPAGTQVPVGRLPFEAISFSGRLVVLDTGYYSGEPQELSIVNPDSGRVERTMNLNSMFPSAVVGHDGDLYISEGFDQKVYRINSKFEVVRDYLVGGYTAGIAPLDKDHLAVIYLTATNDHGVFDQGKLVLLNTSNGKIDREILIGYFPHAIRNINGNLYVTLLGENKLLVYDKDLNLLKSLPVGKTPQGFCQDGDHLYVVNSGSDDISVVDTKTVSIASTVSLQNGQNRFGNAPTSCAIDSDRLYVTESNVDDIAVLDKNNGNILGRIPTGWYPTKVMFEKDKMFVLSAKGISPRRANPQGPQPVPNDQGPQYVLTLLKGSLGIVPKSDIERNLSYWTSQVGHESPIFSPQEGFKLPIRYVFYIVKENRSYDQVLGDLSQGNDDPKLTIFGKEITPNEHKLSDEFVTLDNYFVDGEISVLGHSFTTSGYASPFLEWLGNASYSGRYTGYPFGTVPAVYSPQYLWDALDDKSVDYRVYGENYYLFTRAYKTLVQAFGADGELARKFYTQTMLLASRTDRGREFHDLAQTYYKEAATLDGAQRLLANNTGFTRALSKYFCGDDSLSDAFGKDEKLRRSFADLLYHYPLNYRSWDLDYSDLDRFNVWKESFDDQLKTGTPPQFQYIWLPNDHTDGAKTKRLMPDQFVAQNDAALGKIIQTISNSPIWKESLILVTEDDAQNGPDHVDATRTTAYAVGPYVKRHALVNDRYDQLSMLRTIEVVLGLHALNSNDALAAPMFGIFTDKADLSPYVPTSPSSHLAGPDQMRYRQMDDKPMAVWTVAALLAITLFTLGFLIVIAFRRRSLSAA
jgi:YVTN family beta-propeller protein